MNKGGLPTLLRHLHKPEMAQTVFPEIFSWKTRMLSQNNTKNTRQKASKHGKNTSFQPNFCQKTLNFPEKWPSLPFLLHFYALIFFKVAKKWQIFFQNFWQKNFRLETTIFRKKILVRLFEWKILVLKNIFFDKNTQFLIKSRWFFGNSLKTREFGVSCYNTEQKSSTRRPAQKHGIRVITREMATLVVLVVQDSSKKMGAP